MQALGGCSRDYSSRLPGGLWHLRAWRRHLSSEGPGCKRSPTSRWPACYHVFFPGRLHYPSTANSAWPAPGRPTDGYSKLGLPILDTAPPTEAMPALARNGLRCVLGSSVTAWLHDGAAGWAAINDLFDSMERRAGAVLAGKIIRRRSGGHPNSRAGGWTPGRSPRWL